MFISDLDVGSGAILSADSCFPVNWWNFLAIIQTTSEMEN